MRRVFINDDLENTLATTGRIKIPLLNAEEVARLISFYRANESFQKRPGLHFSLASTNYQFRKEVNTIIAESLRGKTEQLFDKYRMLYGNFMIKEPGNEGDFPLHQDWTYVDEPLYRSIAIWIAMTDNDEQSGCLQFVDRSHLWGNEPRGPYLSWKFESVIPQLRGLLSPVPLKSGEALIWDHRLIHASYPNTGAAARLAATAIFVPTEAAAFHYTKETNGEEKIIKREVDSDFFLRYTMGNMAELNPTIVAANPVEHRPYTEQELAQLVNGQP